MLIHAEASGQDEGSFGWSKWCRRLTGRQASAAGDPFLPLTGANQFDGQFDGV